MRDNLSISRVICEAKPLYFLRLACFSSFDIDKSAVNRLLRGRFSFAEHLRLGQQREGTCAHHMCAVLPREETP